MILLLLLFSAGLCLGETSKKEIVSNFYYQESCANAGGNCVLENECHHPVTEEYKNLCPMQKSEGAVCCKDFPKDALNCYQLHNACYDEDKCSKSLRMGKKGCPHGKTCCVLVY